MIDVRRRTLASVACHGSLRWDPGTTRWCLLGGTTGIPANVTEVTDTRCGGVEAGVTAAESRQPVEGNDHVHRVLGEMPPLGLRMRGTWAEALEPGELCLTSLSDGVD